MNKLNQQLDMFHTSFLIPVDPSCKTISSKLPVFAIWYSALTLTVIVTADRSYHPYREAITDSMNIRYLYVFSWPGATVN
jgi:hypothetical protein